MTTTEPEEQPKSIRPPNPPAAEQAPAVSKQPTGLTYRDLQRTVFLAAGLFVFFYYAHELTMLLLFFLLVFILSAVLNPAVTALESRGVPRVAGAVGVFVLILAAIALVGALSLPPLLAELRGFVGNLGETQRQAEAWYEALLRQYPLLRDHLPPSDQMTGGMGGRIQPLLGQLGRYTVNLLVGIVSLILMIVLVIFTSARPTPLIAGMLAAIPHRHRPATQRALVRILQQLKNWAVGSLILGVIVGLACGVGLKLLGIPYALLFGVIAGIGELIPNIGPVITAVPPALMALTIEPAAAAKVVLLFLVVQQVENSLLVPYIMGQSLNLHPVSVTFTVLVMGALFGILGAILAVPVCAILKVLWEEFYLIPQGIDTDGLEKRARELLHEKSDAPEDSPAAEIARDE